MRIHSKIFPLLKFFSLILLIGACQAQETKVQKPESAAEAIRALSERTYSGAFVIFEANPSGHFIQFYNGGDAIYYDFTIQSVTIIGAPELQKMGKIVEKPPSFSKETITHRFASKEQTEELKIVLDSYQLNSQSFYQLGYSPDGNLTSYFEIIRGEYKIEEDQTFSFLNEVFEKGFGLKNYEISYVAY
ncbi:MAG TPA: hypothetical protein VF181_09625 [Balneolaceae bacterium]